MAGCPLADYAMTVTKIVRFMIDRSINGKMDGGGGCKLDRYFLIADLVLPSRTIRRVE